jgi:hypothetical protein
MWRSQRSLAHMEMKSPRLRSASAIAGPCCKEPDGGNVVAMREKDIRQGEDQPAQDRELARYRRHVAVLRRYRELQQQEQEAAD